MPGMNPIEARVRSAEIKAKLLELFTNLKEPTTAREIARALNTNDATINHNISTLQMQGKLAECGIAIKELGTAEHMLARIYYRVR